MNQASQNQSQQLRLPPKAVDMEKSVLGACMLFQDAFSIASEVIDENCFYVTDHQKIFRAISHLSSGNQVIDILSVAEELKGQIDKSILHSVTNMVTGYHNVLTHSRYILQAFMKREIIRISGDLINEGYEDMGDAFELLEKAEESILKIRQRTDVRNYTPITNALVDAYKHLDAIRHRENHLTGVTSGFKELDKVTCGWQDTDLIILAARPGVGKTAITLNLALNAAKEVPVGFFSLEMSNRQLVHRALSSESGVLLWNLRNGKLTDSEMKTIYEDGMKPIANRKIFIDDTAGLKISELKAKARRMVTKDGVKLIVIDYLQLITGAPKNNRKDIEIGYISAQLKGLAKDLNIPVICLSQLSRDVEKRGSDGEPRLSDLRESGAIEQDADMVLFLWNPTEAEILQDPELAQYCNVKIEKHRNGTLEKFLGKFHKEIQKWEYLKVLDGKGLPLGENWKPLPTWEANM